MIISIDGPAASGKSTTAKLLSEKVGYIHLNSGLLFRAITYVFIENNLFDSLDLIVNDFIRQNTINLGGPTLSTVFWNGKNITKYLNHEDINRNINLISNNSVIREYLIDKQRSISLNKNIVCEGRDIGTVVFPNADYKFFLIASVESRVNRRYVEFSEKNINISKKEIKANLISRDKNDIERLVSPLIKADDAIEIDTTNMSIVEQVNKIYNKIR